MICVRDAHRGYLSSALKKLLGPNWINYWLPGGLILPMIAFGPAREIAAQLEDYRANIASRIA